MKEKLKDWKVLATLSIVFLLLLCLAIMAWDCWWGFPPVWLAFAILFWLSFILFLIFWTKKNWLKILLSIMLFCLPLCWLFFWLYRANNNYPYHTMWQWSLMDLWKDFCIVFSVIFGVCVLALLLNLIRRPSEFISNTKNTKKNK